MQTAGDSSYFCVGHSVLGAYDHADSWILTADALHRSSDQDMVSIHERLHHEFQHTTPWGLIARLTKELAAIRIEQDRYTRIYRFCRDVSRNVHETYATAMSIAGHPSRLAFLDESPAYRTYYNRGLGLAGGFAWEQGRFRVDAVLRACMAPLALAGLSLRRLRLRDLDTAEARPDDRLAALEGLSLAVPVPDLHNLPETPAELNVYYDEAIASLARTGVPVLTASQIREFFASLFADIQSLSPALWERLELDTTREPLSDDIGAHSHEVLRIREPGPMPLTVVPPDELVPKAADFTGLHPRLGRHVVVLWMQPAILARQFERPNAFDDRSEPLVAVSGWVDDPGAAKVLVCPIPVSGPAELVSAFTLPVVCLSTARSLLTMPDVPTTGLRRIFALLDFPVTQLLDLAPTGLAWNVGRITGPRRLTLFTYGLASLPGIVWFQITGEAGRAYTLRWLNSLDPTTAVRRPQDFANLKDELEVAVLHVLKTWFVIDNAVHTHTH